MKRRAEVTFAEAPVLTPGAAAMLLRVFQDAAEPHRHELDTTETDRLPQGP
jgi:hypothetical protein